MQSYLWMRPALQISEAVLLPALPRRSAIAPLAPSHEQHERYPQRVHRREGQQREQRHAVIDAGRVEPKPYRQADAQKQVRPAQIHARQHIAAPPMTMSRAHDIEQE